MNEWMNELRRFCIFFASSNEEMYKSNCFAPNTPLTHSTISHLKSANARHMENFNVIRVPERKFDAEISISFPSFLRIILLKAFD